MSPLFPLWEALYFLWYPFSSLKLIFPSLFLRWFSKKLDLIQIPLQMVQKMKLATIPSPQGSQNEKSKNYLEAGSTVPMIEGWGFSFLGLESSGVF